MAGRRSADVVSVLALVAGFVLALALMVGAFALSFCGLFGEQCTPSEERQIEVLAAASVGVFLAVPVVVAAVRRQARWLLAPVVEAALIVGLVVANGVL